jgi:hypothetical protein
MEPPASLATVSQHKKAAACLEREVREPRMERFAGEQIVRCRPERLEPQYWGRPHELTDAEACSVRLSCAY